MGLGISSEVPTSPLLLALHCHRRDWWYSGSANVRKDVSSTEKMSLYSNSLQVSLSVWLPGLTKGRSYITCKLHSVRHVLLLFSRKPSETAIIIFKTGKDLIGITGDAKHLHQKYDADTTLSSYTKHELIHFKIYTHFLIINSVYIERNFILTYHCEAFYTESVEHARRWFYPYVQNSDACHPVTSLDATLLTH